MKYNVEKMIAELCPTGVLYCEMGKLAQIGTGKSNGNEAEDNGEYPFFIRSPIVKRKNCYEYDEEAIIIPGEGGVGDIFHYINGKYALHQRVYRIHFTTKDVDTRFMYYYLSANFKVFIQRKAVNATVTSIRKPMIEQFPIPLPPLPIQQEIVRILDTFTNFTAELTDKLNAELTARRKQYEYYRDELLTFGEDTREVTLREVVKHSCSGGTPSKGNVEYYSNGNIPWIRTQDVRFNEISEVDSYITERAVEETSVKWIPKNCVIVAISGASAGRCAINKIEATTNQHCLNMEIDSEKALYKYVFYSICSKYQELLDKKQGARGDLNSKLILDTKIALPDLNVQKYIVNILDKFNVIISSLTSGIPAEISARQKQYEYYRDQLLSFQKEKE